MKEYYFTKEELRDIFTKIYSYLTYSKESLYTINIERIMRNIHISEYNTQEIVDLYNKLYDKLKNYEDFLYESNSK